MKKKHLHKVKSRSENHTVTRNKSTSTSFTRLLRMLVDHEPGSGYWVAVTGNQQAGYHTSCTVHRYEGPGGPSVTYPQSWWYLSSSAKDPYVSRNVYVDDSSPGYNMSPASLVDRVVTSRALKYLVRSGLFPQQNWGIIAVCNSVYPSSGNAAKFQYADAYGNPYYFLSPTGSDGSDATWGNATHVSKSFGEQTPTLTPIDRNIY